LDFETINPAIPIVDNSSPYQQLVFQFSLHVQRVPGGDVEHYEYLADTDGSDPRVNFIHQLIENCGTEGDILVYNIGFEREKLQALSAEFAPFAKNIQLISGRLKDLMIPFQEKWYYTPAMQGRYSIKNVLPAMVPELSYKDLAIQEGGTASKVFESMMTGTFKGDENKTRTDLLEYCKLDTLAMVKILEKLGEV